MAERYNTKPLIIKDIEGNPEFTLTFTRETVKWAERRGFKISEVTDFPLTGIQTLFNYSFRAHHPGMNTIETEKIFEELIVDRTQMISRLIELYNASLESLTENTEEGKNGTREMEL